MFKTASIHEAVSTIKLLLFQEREIAKKQPYSWWREDRENTLMTRQTCAVRLCWTRVQTAVEGEISGWRWVWHIPFCMAEPEPRCHMTGLSASVITSTSDSDEVLVLLPFPRLLADVFGGSSTSPSLISLYSHPPRFPPLRTQTRARHCSKLHK